MEDIDKLRSHYFNPSSDHLDLLFRKISLYSLDYKHGIKESDFIYLMAHIHTNNIDEDQKLH